MSRSSVSAMNWEARFKSDTPTLIQSGKNGKSRTGALALDSDNEDQDITMASASESNSARARPVSVAPELYIQDDESPLSQLTKHWMNERHAPDILPAQEELLASLLDHIRRQSEAVQLLRGEPSASEEEHIRIMLVQMEVERVKFIVRSYVRTRLFKIEKFARFIMTDATIQTRITTAERAHASRHAHLTDRHFHNSVLQSLPETQSHLDDTPIFMPPMITKPDETRPVFVHALRDCPPIRFHE
ncbi:hypothetical protein DFH05DRAFT_1504324 [Lentinula detonsa]|uniref:GINS subunit domain-containing protein n=1 Tax=Lentinula detonsa TaxID=2804962 RepID=A0A9W8TVG3_9AGAR|nr:hypothetical protein DFH05DRAFT_1504324 [Lentinula detonsa]